DRLDQRGRIVELLAQLVEVRDLQLRAEPDRAAIGGDLAEHQLEQRRLAGAVGPDESDAVAALHDRVEVTDDDAFAPGLGDADQLDHPLARTVAGVDGKRDAPEPLAALGALASQRLEAAHAA